MEQKDVQALLSRYDRIAEALERAVPPFHPSAPLDKADAYHWRADTRTFSAVNDVQALPLALLKGIDQAKEILLENTRRFASGLPANNALLWGARGTGKSSLVKAVHMEVNGGNSVVLIEIAREDIHSLPGLLHLLQAHSRRFLLLCDDLSFDKGDASYKSLKSVLEGGLEGRPSNVLFYATSNRRHLMPREMQENLEDHAIHPGETADEAISLSDRFGLWLGFHAMDQATYLEIIRGYRNHFGLNIAPAELEREALAWAAGRGARSGRVAWQFITDLAGRLNQNLELRTE